MSQYYNDNEITINYIIDFIKDGLYIDDEIINYKYYYFKPNKNEYNRIGNNYINIIKDKFKDYNCSIIDNNIKFTYNDLYFKIEYNIDNINHYWRIAISDSYDFIFT
jgi:hypothetical protein